MNWRAIFRFSDCVFPLAEPPDPGQLKIVQTRNDEFLRGLPNDKESLEKHIQAAETLVAAESNRRQSVEARLTSILGLTSIAGTIAFGGLFFGSSSLSQIQLHLLRYLVIFTVVYLTVQISSAILAALRGLGRFNYRAVDYVDLVQAAGETENAFLRRKAESTLAALFDQEALNNRKVTQMAIAHRAMLNFFVGLLICIVLGAICATKNPGNDNDLVEKLKANHQLQEALRGPQGAVGPQGPVGPPGPAGPGKAAAPSKAAASFATTKPH